MIPFLDQLHLAVRAEMTRTASVTHRDNHGCSDALLERSAHVVGGPRDDKRDEGIDTHRGEEETGILNAHNVRGEEHDEADSTEDSEAHDEWTADAKLVRQPAGEDGTDGSGDVRRSRELSHQREDKPRSVTPTNELSVGRRVAHVANQGRRE